MKGRIIWQTYYFDERGSKLGRKIFFSEESAANYFYKWIMNVGDTIYMTKKGE